MKPHFFRAFLLIAVLAVTAGAACVVRSHPSRSRHTVHHHDHDRGKHAKHKKHKKHKKHR